MLRVWQINATKPHDGLLTTVAVQCYQFGNEAHYVAVEIKRKRYLLCAAFVMINTSLIVNTLFFSSSNKCVTIRLSHFTQSEMELKFTHHSPTDKGWITLLDSIGLVWPTPAPCMSYQLLLHTLQAYGEFIPSYGCCLTLDDLKRGTMLS